MLPYYDNNPLKKEKLSTTAEASLSPEVGESSSRAGALPQEVAVSLTGITSVITPGDAHSTTTEAAPDVPHHETASTRPNPSVEDTFDNTHATGASGTTPPTTCVNFTCTERDPFRIPEEENRVIKIPNDILRCHPLHGSASPGITGTGITEAGISKASSLGTIGVAGSSPYGTTGPSADPRVDRSTMSATPGITPAMFTPGLGAKLNNEKRPSRGGSHPHNSKRTATGKPQDRICRINTGQARAIGDISGILVDPQANHILPLHPERRTHKHRGQDAET